MNYAARWRLAVATKQPYPNPRETGATDPPPPPVFEVVANDKGKPMYYTGVIVGGIGGFVLGGLLALAWEG